MARLNLDIFSDEKSKQEESTPQPVKVKTERTRPEAEPKPATTKPPKFVPVGFHEEHLRLLDDAVLALRRRGIWKASKSGIIRRLIERHADALEKVWEEADKGPDN